VTIIRDHKEHQRGVVLGLTVAECLLLIVFALLLALGSVVLRKDDSIAKLTSRLVEKTSSLEEANTRVEVLEAEVDKVPNDKFIKELVHARQIVRETDERQRRLNQRQTLIEKNEVLARALAGQPDAARLKALAALGARIEEEIKKTSPEAAKSDPFDLVPSAVAVADAARSSGMGDEQAQKLLHSTEVTLRENSNLRGRVVRLRKQLASVGKGGDYPPCWVTESGEIQYLFNVNLLGDGSLQISDAAPASRLPDREALNIPPRIYGTLGRASFLQLTSGIYAYEQANECRFFVRAVDRTGPAQKKTFKDSLLTVEARFYKVLL
jgi:hypothetical protein